MEKVFSFSFYFFITVLLIVFFVSDAYAFSVYQKETMRNATFKKQEKSKKEATKETEPKKEDFTDAKCWKDFWHKTKITGRIRCYDYSRDFTARRVPDQNAFSLGGNLSILTARFLTGFQLGTTIYTAQSLGLNSDNPLHVDNTLPGFDITPLGQAFLQYSKPSFLIRAGAQSIDSPWLNPADFRMIPATYEALLGTYTPTCIKGLSITGFRMWRYKSRTAGHFNATNLYNDSNIGGTPIPGFDGINNIGTLSFGAKYQQKCAIKVESEVWYYRFYDFANLIYGCSTLTFLQGCPVRPIISAQAVREWGDGSNKLKPFAGTANSTMFGALVGVETDNVTLTLGCNHISDNPHNFKAGDIMSPYTTGYVSDPLYTTSMIQGLIEKASGDAGKISAIIFAYDHRLRFVASYAKYFTQPAFPNTRECNFDIGYQLAGCLKGLELRYRIGVLNGNPAQGRFTYSRVMINYAFE